MLSTPASEPEPLSSSQAEQAASFPNQLVSASEPLTCAGSSLPLMPLIDDDVRLRAAAEVVAGAALDGVAGAALDRVVGGWSADLAVETVEGRRPWEGVRVGPAGWSRAGMGSRRWGRARRRRWGRARRSGWWKARASPRRAAER
ncbi:hypothetical protein HS99_0001555 [Kitasatospora aureofaciens]|uniref:Uncharacterized protein n=1 Tax=Kitasatospora aureofaciens TaxID=1894 RepID=A0A1E7NFZ2_KITAU|nr:hypothetical protein HS99_0001555 [Kitasatospora aureofaciens]